jgi:hypothetical protein
MGEYVSTAASVCKSTSSSASTATLAYCTENSGAPAAVCYAKNLGVVLRPGPGWTAIVEPLKFLPPAKWSSESVNVQGISTTEFHELGIAYKDVFNNSSLRKRQDIVALLQFLKHDFFERRKIKIRDYVRRKVYNSITWRGILWYNIDIGYETERRSF